MVSTILIAMTVVLGQVHMPMAGHNREWLSEKTVESAQPPILKKGMRFEDVRSLLVPPWCMGISVGGSYYVCLPDPGLVLWFDADHRLVVIYDSHGTPIPRATITKH
jgi:hypothetical protein